MTTTLTAQRHFDEVTHIAAAIDDHFISHEVYVGDVLGGLLAQYEIDLRTLPQELLIELAIHLRQCDDVVCSGQMAYGIPGAVYDVSLSDP